MKKLLADTARDMDAEKIWCGQVAALAKTLADAGEVLEIVRAFPIGVTLLKRIAAAEQLGAENEQTAIGIMERSLPNR